VLKTTGNSLFKEIIDDLSRTIQKLMIFFGVDIENCLPRPLRIDLGQYTAIGALLLLSWVSLILEPIGMRLRTSIMHHFYPEDGLERVAWLYKRILKKRSWIFQKTQKRFSYHGVDASRKFESESCWASFKRRVLW
jgi:hypothetical protein